MHPVPAPHSTRRPRRKAGGPAALAAVFILAGCAHVPELEATLTGDLRDSDYPALIPLDLALDPLPAPVDEAERLASSLESRRDSLQARARRLQQPVVDEVSRKRMRAGVAR